MRRYGFTLVEMAIVLIIAGVLAAGSITVVTRAMDNNKYTSTKNQIETIVKEISEYSARARLIPADENELKTIVSTLKDSFQKDILYIPAASLTSAVTGGASSYPTGICSVDDSGLTIYECETSSCNAANRTERENIAFVLVSGSINKNIQADDDSGNGIVRLYNDSLDVDDYSADGTDRVSYDDIAGWLTLDSLKKFAGCEETTLQIIENKLPTAYVNNAYSYTLHQKGGTGPYEWCAEIEDAEIRGDMDYATKAMRAPGGCNNASDFVSSDSIQILSDGALADSYTNGDTRVKVIVRDNNGVEASKNFSLQVIQEYALYLNDMNNDTGSTGGDYSLNSFTIADGTGNNPFTNSAMGSLVDTDGDGIKDTLIFQDIDRGYSGGSVCSFYAGEGVNMKNSSAAVYFRYEPHTSSAGSGIDSALEGFTFAFIPAQRVNLLGVTKQTYNDCGDAFGSLGYGGITDHGLFPLQGETFAMEFDVNYDESKNDALTRQGSKWISLEHIGIVSYITGNILIFGDITNAYNVHDSEYNDVCNETKTNGCYGDDDLFAQHSERGVRIEVFTGCTSGGTNCGHFDTATNNNYTCMYGWVKPMGSVGTDMKDVTTHHMTSWNASPPSALGSPDIRDCFPMSDGSLDSMRFGYTLSADWKEYIVTISTYDIDFIYY